MTTELPRITCSIFNFVHWPSSRSSPYHHAYSDLLSIRLLFYSVVEDDVEEDLRLLASLQILYKNEMAEGLRVHRNL